MSFLAEGEHFVVMRVIRMSKDTDKLLEDGAHRLLKRWWKFSAYSQWEELRQVKKQQQQQKEERGDIVTFYNHHGIVGDPSHYHLWLEKCSHR